MGVQGEPEQPGLQVFILGEVGHATRVDDTAGIHHRDAVAQGAGRIVHRGRMADLAADEALQNRLLGLSLEAHQ